MSTPTMDDAAKVLADPTAYADDAPAARGADPSAGEQSGGLG